jgi:hypothetical protein
MDVSKIRADDDFILFGGGADKNRVGINETEGFRIPDIAPQQGGVAPKLRFPAKTDLE